MSVLATMFVKLVNSECSVRLSKHFFAAFAASQNCKSNFFFISSDSQKFSQLPVQCIAALYNLEITAILLDNTRKSLNFYCFESVQNLVSF